MTTMTRSRKKKASSEASEASEAGEAQGPTWSRELKTPELPDISKDHEFFLMGEVVEARRNLETWWAQGAPELEEGLTKGFSKFTTDLGLGLKYALNCIEKQNGAISNLSEKIETLESELSQTKHQLQEVSAKNADIVNEAEEREKWHQKETFRRDNKLVAPNIVIKNIPFQENEDAKTTHEKVMNIFKKLGAPPESLKFTKATRILKTKKEATGGRKEWAPLVRVTLENPQMKKELFSRLSNLKDAKKYSKLCVQNEYPPCVRGQAVKLEIEAGKYRKSNPGIKTKIGFKDGVPIIMIKDTKIDSRYEELKI